MKIPVRRLLLLIAICLSSACVAIFLASTTLLISTDTLKARILTAFDTQELVLPAYLGNDSRRGRYTVNDCLILQSLLVGRDDWRKIALQSTVLQEPAQSPCATLKSFVHGKFDAAMLEKYEYAYSRYYFGAKTFVGWGLTLVSLEHMRVILRGAIYFLLALTALVSGYGLFRGGRHNPILYATTGVFALGWLLCYDLWYYASTLAHAFSELSLVGFMVFSVLAPPPKSNLGLYAPAAALFALTAWFELLTGPALLAIALVVAVNFAHRQGEKNAIAKAMQIWIVGGSTIVGCLLALLLINTLTSDAESVGNFFKHLAIRLNLHPLLGLSIDERWRTPENLRSYTVAETWQAITFHLPMLTGSSAWLSSLVFGLSTLILLSSLPLAFFRRAHQRFLIPVSIGLSVICWYLLFANHTVIHSWGMVRLMVLFPISAALVLAYFVLTSSNPNHSVSDT